MAKPLPQVFSKTQASSEFRGQDTEHVYLDVQYPRNSGILGIVEFLELWNQFRGDGIIARIENEEIPTL